MLDRIPKQNKQTENHNNTQNVPENINHFAHFS